MFKKLLCIAFAALMIATVFAGCGPANDPAPLPSSGGNPVVDSSSEEPEIVLNRNPLTGLEKTADYPNGKRPVAVMVNNIKSSTGNDAFPQWGIGSADLIYEMVTEGGITRLMAVFSDYSKMPTVGPVRSARDQHVQLMMPYQALYVHEGGSIFAKHMLGEDGYYDENDYSTYNYKAQDLYNSNPFLNTTVVKWDQNRIAEGRNREMCAYTNGEMVSNAVANGADDAFEPKPIFNFVSYLEPERTPTAGTADSMFFQFSSSYYAGFNYDAATGTYKKTNTKGEPHIDGNTGEQLEFKNVLLLFSDIQPYSSLGYDAGMLVHVEYSYGGLGYYFTNGHYEPIRWLKGLPNEPLRIVDNGGNEIDVEINCGKTYIGITDYGMYDYCEINGVSVNPAVSGAQTDISEDLSTDNVEAD